MALNREGNHDKLSAASGQDLEDTCGSVGAASADLMLVVVLALGLLATQSAQAQFTVLHSFTGPPSDGDFPVAGLVQDGKGNLYGTTYYGGILED